MNTRFPTIAATLSIAGLLGWIASSRPGEGAPITRAPDDVTRSMEQERSGGSEVPCAVPLAWRVTRADPRFGIGEEGATSIVQQAADLWEDGVGGSLFRHDPENGFPIRLVYDERQAELTERLRRERTLDDLGAELEAERATVIATGQELSRDTESFLARAQDIERRISAHNASVQAANEQGGASAERRAELVAIGDALGREQDALMAQRPALNSRQAALRESEQRLNRRIGEHQRRVDAFAEEFPSLSVEAGEYRESVTRSNGRLQSVSREIRLYRFESEADLRLIAAHELGHALGLGHTDDPTGVMNAQASSADLITELAESDAERFRALCGSIG